MRRLVSFCGVLLLAGCESTNVAPHQGPAAALADDERRLWARSREEQSRLDQSQFRARLPELEAYLDRIITRLHPEPVPGGGVFRVRVLVDPSLNAFAMPDGAIYVHTGLLAEAENEAQIATVLAHELVHTVHRHSLKGTRQVRNQTAFLATLGAGTMAAGAAGSVAQLLGAVGALASVSGYSRDLEREADDAGFRRLVAAGYDPREAPKVFRALVAELARSKQKPPFFFSTHPRLEERIASYEQLVAALPSRPAPGETGTEAYNAALPPALLLNAEAALRQGEFDVAEAHARRYTKLRPAEPRGLYALAETCRKRGRNTDAATADELLQRLVTEHPQFPDARRSLGLVQMKRGENAAALASFRRYLELSPEAADRAYILEFIRQCESRP